jgi:Family of unknown function (DUF6510)
MEALDGNAVAGDLAEVFGTEMTVFTATCGSCGAAGPVAELAVYDVEMGIVIRCRHCTALLVVITQFRGMSCVDLTGLAALDPP